MVYLPSNNRKTGDRTTVPAGGDKVMAGQGAFSAPGRAVSTRHRADLRTRRLRWSRRFVFAETIAAVARSAMPFPQASSTWARAAPIRPLIGAMSVASAGVSRMRLSFGQILLLAAIIVVGLVVVASAMPA